MANKAATVYIIDVSPTMWQTSVNENGSTAFDLATRAIGILLENKVITERKTDLASVVAVGTDTTDNDYADSDPAFERISIISHIEQPKVSILRKVGANIPRGNTPGDCIAAMNLAVNMIRDHCRHLKYIKKLYLFTNGESTMNTKDSDKIVEQIMQEQIEVKIVGMGFDDPDAGIREENKSTIKMENEAFFKKFTESCDGAIFSMKDFLDRLELPQIKAVKPVPVYKGTLTLGDPQTHPDFAISIDIEMINRTSLARPLSARKWSTLSETSSIAIKTHEVTMSKRYMIKDKSDDENEADETEEPDEVEVSRDDLEKAYTFGKTIIPLASYDEELLRLTTVQSMSILGFLKAEDFRKEYCISNVAVVIPAKDNLEASNRLSALIHGLFLKNAYALVRYVRKNNADPRLGILVPYIKPPNECLYFSKLPFREDYRRCAFPSLDHIDKKADRRKNLPTDEMLEAMENLIKGMDLMEAGIDHEGNPREYLKVKDLYNPVIFRFQKAISSRVLDPESPLPPYDEKLHRKESLLPSLVEKNEELVEEMRNLLNIKKVEPKSKRRRAETNRKGEGEIDLESILEMKEDNAESTDAKRLKSATDWVFDDDNKSFNGSIIRKIGIADPIGDFNRMIDNRQEDLVSSAVEQMCDIIQKMVKPPGDPSLENDSKAIECLRILRKVSARENEAQKFNEFLRVLREECLNRYQKRKDFWQLVIDEKITLISSEEAPDSNTSKKEADDFVKSTMEDKSLAAVEKEKAEEPDLWSLLMED